MSRDAMRRTIASALAHASAADAKAAEYDGTARDYFERVAREERAHARRVSRMLDAMERTAA